MPHIYIIDRSKAPTLPESGCWEVEHLRFLSPAHWLERRHVENNPEFFQIIPYLVLQDAQGQVWCYRRTGGDERLLGRCSCGVGGHVEWQDQQASAVDPEMRTIQTALMRELAEELGAGEADLERLRFRALVYESHTPVGRVHLGMLFTATWLPAMPPKPMAGEALSGLGFRPANAVAENEKYELWSRMAARFIADRAQP